MSMPHGSIFEASLTPVPTTWNWLLHCWACGFDFEQTRDNGKRYAFVVTQRMFTVAMEACDTEYMIDQFGIYAGVKRSKS